MQVSELDRKHMALHLSRYGLSTHIKLFFVFGKKRPDGARARALIRSGGFLLLLLRGSYCHPWSGRKRQCQH